jgi:predicted phosphoribosyltransferase
MFKDRFDAGKQLALKLEKYRENSIILAIPRGGLEIGYEVSKALHVPLDVIITKKIGYPGDSEFAIGAVGPKKHVFLTEIGKGLAQSYIDSEVERLSKAIEARYKAYRGTSKFPNLKNKTVIIVDDGIATGSTMLAAIDIVKEEKPSKVIVAVPVSPPDAVFVLKQKVDEVICLQAPPHFGALSQFYQNFEQVTDEQAIEYLQKANK